MIYFLANLHQGFPGVLCSEFGAVWTLSILNDVFNLEYLLKNGRSEYLHDL